MAGMTKKAIDINVTKGSKLEYVNDLNKFYARHGFSNSIKNKTEQVIIKNYIPKERENHKLFDVNP